MTINARQETVFDAFVEAKARHTGIPEDDVLAKTSPDAFYNQLMALHQQFMGHECSIGYVADQLGISPFDLDDILTRLGLPLFST